MDFQKKVIDLTDDVWLLDDGTAVNIPGNCIHNGTGGKVSRRFRCPKDADLSFARLVADQINREVVVKVNGYAAGTAGKEAVRHVIPVGKYLVNGINTIELSFQNETECAASPHSDTISFYGDIYVDISPLFVEKVHLSTEKAEADWIVRMEATVQSFTARVVARDKCCAVFLKKKIYCPGSPLILKKGSNTVKICFRVSAGSVLTWNPAGSGPHTTYKLTFCIEDAVPYTVKTGFREVKFPEKPGESLVVNGQKVRIRGVAILPENAGNRLFHEVISLLNVRRIIEMGFNAVVIPHNGRYESDFLYELFDDAGLMVFHELICGPSAGNESRKEIDSLLAEAEWQVCRLSAHPSLIAWKLRSTDSCAAAMNLRAFIRNREPERYISAQTGEILFREIEGAASWPAYETLRVNRLLPEGSDEKQVRRKIAKAHLLQAEDFIGKYDGGGYVYYYLNETEPGLNGSLADSSSIYKPLVSRIRSLNLSDHIVLLQEENSEDISFRTVLRNGEAEEISRVRFSVMDFDGNELLNYTSLGKGCGRKKDSVLDAGLRKLDVPWFILASGDVSPDVLVPRQFRSAIPDSGIRITGVKLGDSGIVTLELENDRPAFSVLLYSTFPGEFSRNLFDMPERRTRVEFNLYTDVLYSMAEGCEKLADPQVLITAFAVWDSYSLHH